MAKETLIEYCDSTVNALVGCDGCELWLPKRNVRHCYAGNLVGKYAGGAGWPASFDEPELFVDRIRRACDWTDLAEQERPDKPWLSGFPRIIFLNDLGDTFTESVPTDWLQELIPRMAASPHIWLFLTKRAKRMKEFFIEYGYVPANFWLGVSVTNQRTLRRLVHLFAIPGEGIRWVSFEPILGFIHLTPHIAWEGYPTANKPEGWLNPIHWAVVGGGSKMRATDPDHIDDLIAQLTQMNIYTFFKQYGELAANPKGMLDPTSRAAGGISKGGRQWRGIELVEMPDLPERRGQREIFGGRT